MKSEIVGLPQSDYKYFIYDPSQPVHIQCGGNLSQGQSGIITLSQADVINILEWAYPAVIYENGALPEKSSDIFPAFILNALRCRLDGKGYEKYEVRYNEESNEFFLIGLKLKKRYHLAQWRKHANVRTLRMIVDDAAPSMHQFISRHARGGILSIFLGGGSLALYITYWRLTSLTSDASLMLLYMAYMFFGLSGIVVAWFGLNYKRYLSATTIILLEEFEYDPISEISPS